jgi:TM2 domain-containing membrane protein YozV
LYLKIFIKQFFLLYFTLLIIFINTGLSQKNEFEEILESEQNLDTVVTTFWPNIIRSAIIPGYGQIMQERPGKAIVFYGIAGSLIYNSAYNYYWYERTNNNKYLTRFRKFTLLYSQLYLINVLDAVNTQIDEDNLVWQSNMFSDKPMKSPWGAAVRSAMLPGLGQIYNDQYIKAIITFGIVTDFVRKAIISNIRYMDTGKKGYLERRSVNTWYAGLAYTLNIVDAFVDAYLYKFDEIMELSIEVIPIEKTYGFSLILAF